MDLFFSILREQTGFVLFFLLLGIVVNVSFSNAATQQYSVPKPKSKLKTGFENFDPH